MTNVKNLLKKYKEDALSYEELVQLRTLINGMPDSDLESLFSPDDDDFIDNGICVPVKVKHAIDAAIARYHMCRVRRMVIWRIAALFIVACVTAGSVLIYGVLKQNAEYGRLVSNVINMQTGHGESMVAMLPDGSKVRMGYNSTLRYCIGDFNSSGRAVEFTGEGAFDVVSDASAPMVVRNGELSVTVLGTVFSVEARENEDNAVIYLKEGMVELMTGSNSSKVVLRPDEMALVDRKSGGITVECVTSPKESVARLKGERMFDSCPAGEVLVVLSRCYGIDISFENHIYNRDIFTGVIPTDNLDAALRIIEENYNVERTRVGNEIVLK